MAHLVYTPFELKIDVTQTLLTQEGSLIFYQPILLQCNVWVHYAMNRQFHLMNSQN